MHVIGPDHFDDNDDQVESFAIRSKVRAVPCQGGAQLTDDEGNVTASYGDDCYVVEGDDGDHRIVSRYVFDGLYEPTDPGETEDDFADASGDYAPGQPGDGSAAVPTPEQAQALRDAEHDAASQGGAQRDTQRGEAQQQTTQAAGRRGTARNRPAKATQPAKTTPARGGQGGRGGRRGTGR